MCVGSDIYVYMYIHVCVWIFKIYFMYVCELIYLYISMCVKHIRMLISLSWPLLNFQFALRSRIRSAAHMSWRTNTWKVSMCFGHPWHLGKYMWYFSHIFLLAENWYVYSAFTHLRTPSNASTSVGNCLSDKINIKWNDNLKYLPTYFCDFNEFVRFAKIAKIELISSAGQGSRYVSACVKVCRWRARI